MADNSSKSNSAFAPKASGTDKKKANGDGKEKKLAPEEVDLAVAELRYLTAFQMEVAQARIDGVTLGAEQAQEKRISILELGEVATTEEFLGTVVMTLILEGTIGPLIAAVATRVALRPLLRNIAGAIGFMSKRSSLQELTNLRTAAGKKHHSAMRGPDPTNTTRANLLLEAQELYRAADLLERNVRGQFGATRKAFQSLNKVTRFVQDNLVAVAKVPGATNYSLPESDMPASPEDAPAVNVVSAAMASASLMRLTIVAAHEAREAQLRHPDTTVDEVAALLDEYRPESRVDLAEIRASYAIATEAVIWARLLLDNQKIKDVGDREDRAKKYLDQREQTLARDYWTDPVAGVRPSADFARLEPQGALASEKDHKLDTKPALVKYLLIRFGREVERWASEGKRVVFTPSAWESPAGYRAPRGGDWWQKTNPLHQEDLLVQYLAAVAKNIPSDSVKLQ